MKKTLTSLFCLLMGIPMMYGQIMDSFKYEFPQKQNDPFNKLDVALTLGSSGVGIDVASSVTDFMQVRAGVTYIPKFEYKINFPVEVGEGTQEEQQERFKKLSGMLEKITGHKVNDNVCMIAEPTFYNFKILFDFFPFENKRWHVTGGSYFGSSCIGKAYNAPTDMPSLFAVKTYNHIYDLIKEKYENDLPLLETEQMSFYVSDDLMNTLNNYGRMGVNMGENHDGSIYYMEPDENSMVVAQMKVNRIRPYLGFGYGSSMMSGNSKYNISFDCGVLFWGGTPSILIHDGTDLANNIKNVPGKVGKYVRLAKTIKAFPVLEVRISRRLF